LDIESIKPGIWIAYGTVLVVLLLGSGTTRVLINRFPERDYTELRLRVRTWWMIAVPVAATLVTAKALSILLLATISGLALKEYLALVATRHRESRALWFVYLAVPVQFWFAWRSSYVAFAAFIPLFTLVTLPMITLSPGGTPGILRAAAAAYVGLVLTVFSVSHIALLLMLPDAPNPAGGAVGLVVFLLLITQLNDVSQYVFGKCFGRRPIVPRVSPRKTVEGFAGGVLVSSLIASWIGPLLTPMDSITSPLAGALLACAGFGGDLAVSALKRDYNVKDMGSLLPGHGGILDRIDSLLCAGPLFFYAVYFMYYAG
jgi:phosphatidate cytidylyltransferase